MIVYTLGGCAFDPNVEQLGEVQNEVQILALLSTELDAHAPKLVRWL